MTFEEWSKSNPDLDLDCDECDGTGTHECSCGNEHDCPACFGNGSEKYKLYLEQLHRDKLAIERVKLVSHTHVE